VGASEEQFFFRPMTFFFVHFFSFGRRMYAEVQEDFFYGVNLLNTSDQFVSFPFVMGAHSWAEFPPDLNK